MDEIEYLMASGLATAARMDVLENVVAKMCEAMGIRGFDDMPVKEFFQSEKIAQLERMLIQFEDSNPTAAAYLSNLIDKARENSSSEPPAG